MWFTANTASLLEKAAPYFADNCLVRPYLEKACTWRYCLADSTAIFCDVVIWGVGLVFCLDAVPDDTPEPPLVTVTVLAADAPTQAVSRPQRATNARIFFISTFPSCPVWNSNLTDTG